MLYSRKGLGIALYSVLADAPATETYDQFPEDLFPGMASDGTDLTIPITTMTDYGLTAAHCVPGSGDARQLAHCLTARIKDWYISTASGVRPAAMEASVRRSVGLSSGSFPNIPKDEYKLVYYIDWPDETVVDEP